MPTKLRAAFLGPCIGAGGADALMCGLVAQCRSIEWSGIATTQPITDLANVEWARASGVGTPIWCPRPPLDPYRGQRLLETPRQRALRRSLGVRWAKDWESAAVAAARDADVVISWCVADGWRVYPRLAPALVVEMLQGQDSWAVDIAVENLQNAEALVCCSKAVVAALPNHVQPLAAVIYNGADPRRVAPAMGGAATRRALRIAPDQKLLLSLGRLVPTKNPHAAIQALTALPSEWQAVVLGRGDDLALLDRMAKAFAPERVRLAPFVYHVGDYLAAADVVLLVSDCEGDSLALHEAALAGVPVATTPVGSVPELEEHYGPMVAKIDQPEITHAGEQRTRQPTAEEIAAAVLMADSDEFRERVVRAQQTRWRHFTLPMIAHEWAEYLHGVVERARRRERSVSAKWLMHAQPATRQ